MPCWAGNPTIEPPQDTDRRPSLAIAYGGTPTSDFEGTPEGRDADGRDTRLAARLLWWGDKDRQFSIGMDYQYTVYQFGGIESRDRDLHRLQLPLTWKRSGSRWRLTGHLAPGWSTSSNVFKDLAERSDSEDLIVTGRVEAHRSGFTGEWQPIVGLAYDRGFGDPTLYPILGFNYASNENLSLRLALPDSEVDFTLAPKQRLSLKLFPAGHQWHVVSDEQPDEFDYTVEAFRIRGTWSVQLWRTVWLGLSAGYEFGRRHEFIDDLGQPVRDNLDDQWTLGLSFHLGDPDVPMNHRIP